MRYEDLFSYLISPPLPRIIFILFFIFSTFLFFSIIYFLLKSDWWKRAFWQDLIEVLTFKPYEIKIYLKIWAKIEKRMEMGLEEEAKLAIIEADDLLNEALKKIGYQGESLGERLEKLDETSLPNLNEVFKAHSVRSNIIHDPDYKLNLEEAKRILKIYQKTLEDLEAI